MHTYAPPGGRHQPASRKAMKQQTERLRRDRRELGQALQERAARECYPRNDEGPPPRID